ncbi:MAG: FecR family protein [Bacteroidales bacterium]|jgi:ferric-dicitrate binding protein FerR (iron transport regulator)|nr:FecR family protein [Bacteroidales bacterium]
MNSNRIEITDALITRYFSGNISPEEQQYLLAWVNANPENEEKLFLMKDIYDAGATIRLHEEAKTREGWDKLQKIIAEKQKTTSAAIGKVNYPHWTDHIRRYAAIFVLGVSAGLLSAHFYSKSQNKEQAAVIAGQCEIKTGKGERVTITLPDGSTIKLNACSSLSYPDDFGRNLRELQFTGEGYFDVQTNADMPFVVKTSGLNIKALGTTFNVRAYADEDVVETTLVKGLVTVENDRNRNIATLKPNQVIAIPKKLIATTGDREQFVTEKSSTYREKEVQMPEKAEQKAVLTDRIEPAVYTSWKDGRWIIRSESLESLAKKMERKYDVEFSFEDEASKKYVFAGTLKDYPLEQILEVIRLNAPIQYAVKEKNVIISEDKQLKKKYKQLIQSPM